MTWAYAAVMAALCIAVTLILSRVIKRSEAKQAS